MANRSSHDAAARSCSWVRVASRPQRSSRATTVPPSSGEAPSTACATTGDSRICRHSMSWPRTRTLPGASPATTLPRCCRPLPSSTTSGPSPKSTTTVIAGYGMVRRSTRSVARARNPAIVTPGSRPGRDGMAISHKAAPSRADSADRMPPGYEPPPAVARRRDIRPRRNPGHATTLTASTRTRKDST